MATRFLYVYYLQICNHKTLALDLGDYWLLCLRLFSVLLVFTSCSIFKYDEAACFQVHSNLHHLYPSSSRLRCPVTHAVNQGR